MLLQLPRLIVADCYRQKMIGICDDVFMQSAIGEIPAEIFVFGRGRWRDLRPVINDWVKLKLSHVSIKDAPRIRFLLEIFAQSFGDEVLYFVETDGDFLSQRQFDEKQKANRMASAEVAGRVECGGGGGGGRGG